MSQEIGPNLLDETRATSPCTKPQMLVKRWINWNYSTIATYHKVPLRKEVGHVDFKSDT